MKKGFLSVLLTLFMMLMMLPTTAYAGKAYCETCGKWVGTTSTYEYKDGGYHWEHVSCAECSTNISNPRSKHNWSGTATCTSGQTCTVCGGTSNPNPLGHAYESTVTIEPTCTTDGVRTYVCKNDSNTIYTVSGTKAACFELTRAELFGAFNPAGLTASEIEAVSYTLADGETVTLKANSEPAAESGSNAYQTVWRLAGDTAADLDETKVDAILSALCTYVSAQATDADPAAYGFEAPLVTAEVTTADGTINLTYAMGTDGCYLMVEGDSSVYTVDASVVSALLYPADQLKAE